MPVAPGYLGKAFIQLGECFYILDQRFLLSSDFLSQRG